ncbi:prolipoprotein diacylglyceryl transferase [Nitrosococcus wardiae]|uniref:Phosphatidylglycerol--prolipoprotein diacylglyceryl transferase n=2 Tax=Nitrosococcus wardiae TaxID=1814290 RepID=A0A4P7C496_9GAMM|nr:prolipoprotein diacylglyceryl transferase [Nitrosococcus wardiae]
MISYPNFDPVAFSLGPLKVHWYGIMYLIGFLGAWGLGRLRAKRPTSGWRPEQVDDLIFYGALGVILGGRLGYALFYDFDNVLADPLRIFKIWQGGMSFHGGLLGVLVAMAIYARKVGKRFFQVTDFVAPLVPIGLGAGRIGNFINGELWGKVTDVPWGMVFPDPRAGDLPRHPSQLYEAALEGVALFLILWFFSSRPRPTMAVSGLFLLCYGLFRFIVEFVRVPDAHLGYLAFGWLTMGQVLSLPMILIGVILLGWAYLRANRFEKSWR